MNLRIWDLTRIDKIIIIIWLAVIAAFDGMREANAFEFLNYQDYNFPAYFTLTLVQFIIIMAIIPILTHERSDWLLVFGGGFVLQFWQDIAHWFARLVIVRNWNLGDPFWTPLWNSLGISFPIPLFWFIDWIIATVFIIIYIGGDR